MTFVNRVRELGDRGALFFKAHSAGIIFSLVVGLIVIAPEIVVIQHLGSNYRGLPLMATADETYYVARINSVYHGGDGTKDPYIYESRNEPATSYDYAELILAAPGMVLGQSAVQMNLIYKFILPAIAAFLWYLLCFRLTKSKLWSICITGTIFLAYPFFIDLSTVKSALTDFFGSYTNFLRYARPVNPQFSSIFFVGYLHVFLSALRQRTSKYFIWLGIYSGCAFYIYLFLSTFILTLNCCAVVWSVCRKDFDLVKKLLLSIGLGVAIGSYFVYHSYLVVKNPLYAPYARAINVTASHVWDISQVSLFTYGMFAVYLALRHRSRKPFDIDNQFLLLILATTFLVINQQVITGFELQRGHYHWYFNVPIYIFVLFYILYDSMRDSQIFAARKYIFPIVVTCLAVFWGFYTQLSTTARISAQYYAESQVYVPLLNYLSSLPPDSVIFANNELSELIPVATHNYVVWAQPAQFFLVPTERRAFNQDNLLSSGFQLKKFGNYRLDYLVWDTKNDPTWKIDQYHFFRLIEQIGDFKVYRSVTK